MPLQGGGVSVGVGVDVAVEVGVAVCVGMGVSVGVGDEVGVNDGRVVGVSVCEAVVDGIKRVGVTLGVGVWVITGGVIGVGVEVRSRLRRPGCDRRPRCLGRCRPDGWGCSEPACARGIRVSMYVVTAV